MKSFARKLAPRAIRPYRIMAGPLSGRVIVTSLHDYPAAIFGWTERPLLAWLRKNVMHGETWLDVGAHYGYTAIALADLVGQNGRVYAFEPSLSTAGHLNRTRTLNRLDQIRVIPLGLSDSVELQLLSVPINRGMADHSLSGAALEHICVASFDELRAGVCPQRVDGVKVDVQGMELSVLVGMRKTLVDDGPKVIIEFHSGVDRRPILDLLHSIGYCLPGTPIRAGAPVPDCSYYDDCSYLFVSSVV